MPTEVEDMYRQAIDAMTPAERIARMVAISAWGRSMIAKQVIRDLGPMSDKRLKWQVALRLYGDDPQSRQLIEEQLENVRD